MFWLKAVVEAVAVAAITLFSSTAIAQTGIAGKQDPAASFARNLTAVSESMLRYELGSPRTCLSARQHRRRPSLRTRCKLQKPQPVGLQ